MQDSQNNIDLDKLLYKRTRYVGISHKVGGLLLFGNRDEAGNPASPIYRQYGHMLSCNSKLIQENGTIRGVQHCKCRGCIQCNRTRTAALIDEYYDILKSQKELYFVTLTRRNVKESELYDEVRTYYSMFHQLMTSTLFRQRVAPGKQVQRYLAKVASATDKISFWSERMMTDSGNFIENKRRNQKIKHFQELRSKAETELAKWQGMTALIGIRKFECTYHDSKFLTIKDRKGRVIELRKDKDGNPIPDPWYDTYHPHFHLIVNSKEMADWIEAEWLRLNEGFAEAQSQDVRKCESDGVLLDLFKYFSKMFSKTIHGYRVYPKVLDNILVAINGLRIFQRFGSDESWKCPEIDEDNVEEEAIAVDDQDNDTYIFVDEGEWGSGTWSYVSYETGRILASVPKRGPLCKMLQDTERDVGFDPVKAEEIRREVYYEPQPKRYNPAPDVKAILRKKQQKTLRKQ